MFDFSQRYYQNERKIGISDCKLSKTEIIQTASPKSGKNPKEWQLFIRLGFAGDRAAYPAIHELKSIQGLVKE